jgi:tRNA U34 2-thiouridine synthase MnmA/TrmU
VQNEKLKEKTADVLGEIGLPEPISALAAKKWDVIVDLKFVRSVCEQLDVPLEVISLQSEYLERVVSYALDELRIGRTPSPDIFCNQRIKFGAFFDHIDTSYEKVATGHYAQIAEKGAIFAG